uniref:Uncharacterized protein n=1 Tax=Rhizophora mucronata TaxID=61149 RepID=A0A2P2MXP1_RHIMU
MTLFNQTSYPRLVQQLRLEIAFS